jgi:hypothetical protein
MAVLPTGIGPVTGGYQIERSLRFNSADSAYLNRTPASAGNRKTWTWSGWVKKTGTGTFISADPNSGNRATSFYTRSITDGRLEFEYFDGTTTYNLTCAALLRDPSAYYHLILAVDTTQATNTNRTKIYVNGVQQTLSGTYVPQNTDMDINNTVRHNLGRFQNANAGAVSYLDGYLTEVNFIDGQALTPSDFGETDSATGVWKPKSYTGTYGTNGFFLKFADNSGTTSTTLGKDSSANGNNWTPNNFSVTAGAGNDSLVDSPTAYGTDTGVGGSVRGNYATWNPLKNSTTLSDGNLRSFNSSTTQWLGVVGTFGMTSGKWYWEYTPTVAATVIVGLANSSYSTGGHPGSDANSWGYYSANGQKYFNNSGSAYGATYTANDVIGVAFDADAGTLTFYKNGVSQGTAYSSLTSGPYFPAVGVLNSQILFINAGQRAFAYTAPSGFKALVTTNLPTPTIGATSTTQADNYFGVALYSGTGSGNSNVVSGLEFTTDLWWQKARNAANNNYLQDAVRGFGASKSLTSNSTGTEGFNGTPLTQSLSVSSTGFTVSGSDFNGNTSSETYVAWCWNAGGSNATNTAGTITSTVRANTTSGFSIVTYTGTGANATVGHGLGVAPKFVIIKIRNSASDWVVYSADVGNTKYLQLSTTAAAATASTVWNNTTPTSTVFSLGSSVGVNQSTSTYVAYCFSEVAGYSKFGSYTGNGSADGPFVYTGFRPRWIMMKRTDQQGSWWIEDTSRAPYNPENAILFPNLSNAEFTTAGVEMDGLSNGFKIRNSNVDNNASGGTYIYMAFAETPAKFSLAR